MVIVPSRRRRSGALSPGAAIGSIKRTVALPSRFLAAPQGSRGRSPRSMRPPSRCAHRGAYGRTCLSPGDHEPSSLWKSARFIAVTSPVRCESAVPMTAKLALPRKSRVVVSRFGQSAPVFTTTPSTILGPRILTPSAVTHNHSDAGSGRSSRTAGVNVGGLDRRVELHRIAALLARPIARALAAAERHVIVDAGRR